MQYAISFLIKKEPIFKQIIEQFGQPIIQKRDEGFAAMCHIILEQQVSIASAKACYVKLENHFGKIVPKKILEGDETEFRACGVSHQKTKYLKDLAERVISNQLNFENLSSKTEAEIRAELLQIKGVGTWTIDVYLMFCLQTPDVMPFGDIAIRNTLIELYDCKTLEEMEELSTNWKPYRTAASFVLWHHYLGKRKRL